MLARLRQIWIDPPDEMSRALLNEIARLHGVLRQIDEFGNAVTSVWLAERGGTLAALHQLNRLLEQEPAVMEQKHRRSGRGVSPLSVPADLDDSDGYPHIPLDQPSRR